MDLSLVQGNGDSLRISDFRHRRNLVVLFTGEAGFGRLAGLVKALSARYAEFRAEKAEILVVVAPSPDFQAGLGAGLPLPVARPQAGGLDREQLAGPGITVLDRYGEVYAAYRLGGGEALPTADELLEWLRFIELQCPE